MRNPQESSAYRPASYRAATVRERSRLPWFLLLLLASSAQASAPLPYEALHHVRVPMRDGMRLDANVFHTRETARQPVLLVRTPYGKGDGLLPGFQLFI